MPRATTIVRRAAIRADAVADTVSLDHAGRQAGHGHLHTEGGLHLDLALAKAASLEDGDALRLDDGRLVLVRAAPEPLLEVTAENPARLMRLAWQLGGNHVPAEVGADRLHVPASAAELVRGQGCIATAVSRAFRPERMAHDHSTCGHDHGHDHAPAHGAGGHGHDAQDQAQDHAQDHAHGEPHVHGPGCDHGH